MTDAKLVSGPGAQFVLLPPGLLGMPSVLLTASARGLYVRHGRARGLLSSIRSLH